MSWLDYIGYPAEIIIDEPYELITGQQGPVSRVIQSADLFNQMKQAGATDAQAVAAIDEIQTTVSDGEFDIGYKEAFKQTWGFSLDDLGHALPDTNQVLIGLGIVALIAVAGAYIAHKIL